MKLRKIRAFFERRTAERDRLQAAEDFAWTWADTVNTDAYAYGASLECDEAQALGRFFMAFGYDNTAAELLAEHAGVCEHQEPHAEVEEVKR
ncbi:hypothetical protein [Actinacidiphila glaucinigra]|uniref:hypothetical protein n=1 Tax=Actinacidiphila glaucinigra TaxID=235986 RepID=UPI00366E49B1